MQFLSAETQALIAPDTAFIYDMLAVRDKQEVHAHGLDVVRASAIVVAVLEQTVEIEWPEHLHQELAARKVYSHYPEMTARQKRQLARQSFRKVGPYTNRARTIPQDVQALRQAVESTVNSTEPLTAG
jgi:hypothetical protein